MARETGIAWTDATWPIVQGCDYESPGCTNCYAVPLIWRMQQHPHPGVSGPIQGLVEKRGDKLAWTGKVVVRHDRMDWPLKWKKPLKIFVPSHGDIFHPAVPFRDIAEIFFVMTGECSAEPPPRHTYQILTKRPKIALEFFKWLDGVSDDEEPWLLGLRDFYRYNGPPKYIWIGVSVEDQRRADERIPYLRQIPARVRFLSVEPMLEAIDLWSARYSVPGRGIVSAFDWGKGVNWVIIGGESGAGARDFHIEWARALIRECLAADVAVFMKQLGRWAKHDGNVLPLHARKGDDPKEWPADLRLQQFPKGAS